MNIVRSLFLTGWAYAHGADAIDADFWGHPEFMSDAQGNPLLNAAKLPVRNPDFHLFSVHDFAGYLVLGLTLAGLLLLLPILNYKIKLPDDPADSTPTEEPNPPPART
jgi:hypothetical protein